MASIGLPTYLIPGNHDNRENMREAFQSDKIFTKTGPLNWHKKIGDINIIGLDTLIQGKGEGYLGPKSLEYLKETLKNLHSQPTILALHHPPFETGIKFMDDIGLKNKDEFKDKDKLTLKDEDGDTLNLNQCRQYEDEDAAILISLFAVPGRYVGAQLCACGLGWGRGSAI